MNSPNLQGTLHALTNTSNKNTVSYEGADGMNCSIGLLQNPEGMKQQPVPRGLGKRLLRSANFVCRRTKTYINMRVIIFPKPYRESTVRQLQDTALAQQKGGLPSADALELSLQACINMRVIITYKYKI